MQTWPTEAVSRSLQNLAYQQVPDVQANATYMDDPEMAKRLMETNPNSFRKLVATFLEANGRGYWDASPDQLDRLRELYMDVEDKIEGVE